MNMRFTPPALQADIVPTLVLIHDVLSSPLEFSALAQILGARQAPFEFLEIPGYTHGSGKPALAWRTWLATAGELLDARFGADAPVVLGGLGAGGALAAALALARRPQQVHGVALLSSMFVGDALSASPTAAHRAAAAVGFDRWVMVGRTDPFGIKNPKTRKWIARELEEHGQSSIGPARLPLRALRESERLHAHVRGDLARLSRLLVLHAREDAVADISGVESLVAGCGAQARLVTLEHSYRMITVDNDRQRVAHELADFIGAPKRQPVEAPATARPRRVAVASH